MFLSKKWRSTEGGGPHAWAAETRSRAPNRWPQAIGCISGFARYRRIAEFPRFVAQPRNQAISLVYIRYGLLREQYVPMAAASKAKRSDQPSRHQVIRDQGVGADGHPERCNGGFDAEKEMLKCLSGMQSRDSASVSEPPRPRVWASRGMNDGECENGVQGLTFCQSGATDWPNIFLNERFDESVARPLEIVSSDGDVHVVALESYRTARGQDVNEQTRAAAHQPRQSRDEPALRQCRLA